MSLPKQVQEQAEAIKKYYEQKDGTEQADKSDAQPQQEAQVESEIVEPEITDSPQEPESTSTLQELEPADNVHKPEPLSEAKEPQDNKEETWEHKYKTLQGMYNREVPHLLSQNKDFVDRLSHMEQLLSDVSTQPVQNQQEPQRPASLITERDVEDYGDSIDVMRRAAQEEVAKETRRVNQLEAQLRQLQSNIVPQVNKLSQTQTQTGEKVFWDEVSSKVPNWQSINENQDFQSWLLDLDPLTGMSRQTYLEDAQANLDAGRVANFFTAWMQKNGGVNTQNKQRAKSSQLANQVAPGRGRSVAPSSASEGAIYTPSDIKTFYDDVRKGKYKGQEKERNRIERDIFIAQKEGRISYT